MNPIEIFADGAKHSGTYRVIDGSVVIVYYGGETKFTSVGTNPPELVAKWLLRDLISRVKSTNQASPGI